METRGGGWGGENAGLQAFPPFLTTFCANFEDKEQHLNPIQIVVCKYTQF